MVYKSFFTLALATGFAAAKPINQVQNLPAYVEKRNNGASFQSFDNGQSVNNNFNGQGFNFIDGFNGFNNQQQVLQVQQQNLQIVNNGFQQAVVQQVNEVLIIDQQNNGFNRDLNNLFRKSNFRNNRRDEATVMLVVQQINVAVQDDRGNQFQQDVFAQSALIANRGARTTNTIMIFESKAIIATQLINDNRNRNFNGNNRNNNFGNFALPTKTADFQLFGSRPTWSAVADDPAATLGAIWQAELEDLQRAENDGADNQLNSEAAQKEKASLDQQGQNAGNGTQNAAGEEQKNAEATASQSTTSDAAAQTAEATATATAEAEA